MFGSTAARSIRPAAHDRDDRHAALSGAGRDSADDAGAERCPWALLVAPGKHGADALVRGFDGARVTLEATRIQRGQAWRCSKSRRDRLPPVRDARASSPASGAKI